MIKSVFLKMKKDLYQYYNGLLFNAMKIPVIGKIIPSSVYKLNKIEDLIVPLSIIWALIKSFISKFLSYFVFIGIYSQILFTDRSWFNNGLNQSTSTLELVLYVFVLYKIIVSIFNISKFYSFDKDTYISIKIMRLKPRNYLLGNLFYSNLIDIITTVTIFSVFLRFSGANFYWYNVLYFMLFLTGLNQFFTYLSLSLNIRDSKKSDSLIYILIATMLVIFIMFYTYNIITQKIVNFSILFTMPIGLIGFILNLIFSILLLKSEKLDDIVYSNLTKKDHFDSLVNEDVNVQIHKANLDHLTLEKHNYDKYTGIKYINKIMFDRLKDKRWYFRYNSQIFISIIIIGASIYLYNKSLPSNSENLEDLKSFIPIIAFLIPLFLLNGNSFIKNCFVNLDSKLMRYKYYRTPAAILESIKVRSVEMLTVQILPIITYLIALVFIGIKLEIDTQNIGLILVFGILGVLFFTLNYLVAYYLIQPFTENLKVKNPIYSLFNWILYFVIVLSASIFGEGRVLIGIIAFLVAYIIFAIYGIKYLAPKRFKLR